MVETNMAKRFTQSGRIIERKIRDERILVPVMGSMEALDSIYTLDETAGRIWDAAIVGADEDAITRKLCEEYDVPAETARKDVRTTLDELVRLGALEILHS
jgi:hypothetical protein